MRNSKLQLILSYTSFIGVRLLIAASAILGSFMILFAGYSLYEQIYTQNRAFESGIGDFESEEEIIESQSNIAEEYEDYRAWIRLTDTKIDYPVMQGKDDLYYANHDVNGQGSLTGAIYMASANKADLSDNYIVLFGHHMDNGAMFGGLDRYLEEDYLKTHQKGIIISPERTFNVVVFAAIITDAYDENIYTVGDRDLSELMEYISSKAKVEEKVNIDPVTKIIALSTCADATTNGRLVVFCMEDPDGVVPEPTITPKLTGEAVVPDKQTETKKESLWDRIFNPGGSSYGKKAWALLNLICLIVTIYILFPLFHLRAKYGRIRNMKAFNEKKAMLWDEENLTPEKQAEREKIMAKALLHHGYKGGEITEQDFKEAIENMYYDVSAFAKKFRIGIIAQAAASLLALIVFILTENMRLPMTIIDRWTPIMLVLMLLCWLAGFLFTRYKKALEEEQKDKAEQSA